MKIKLKNYKRAYMTDKHAISNIRSFISAPNPRKKYCKYDSDYICPITVLGSFPIGLTYRIYTYLTQTLKRKVEIEKEVLNKLYPLVEQNLKLLDIPNKKFQYRDYQKEAISELLKVGRGIVLHATGAGKSLEIFSILYSMYNQGIKLDKFVILVPNIQLVKQLFEDFLKYDEKFTKTYIRMYSSFASETSNLDYPIIITNRQWLQGHISDFNKEIEAIIVDECHQITKGNKISKFVENLQTDIKIGFTGTLPEDFENRMYIEGVFGSIIHEKNPHELQNEGILANIKIYPIKIRFISNPFKPQLKEYEDFKKWYLRECEYIESSKEYNTQICKLANKLNGNTIILFNHIKHGKNLLDICTKISNKKIWYVDGSVDLYERINSIESCENTSGNIIIANYKCFGTGINVKNVQNIIFAASSKSVTKVIQAIGRGLRKIEGKKIQLNLFDFFVDLKYSIMHFKKRLGLYNKFYKISIKKLAKTISI